MTLNSLAREIKETVSAFPIVLNGVVLFRKGTYNRAVVEGVVNILGKHGLKLRRRSIPLYAEEPRLEDGGGYYYVDRCPNPDYATPWQEWYPSFKMRIAVDLEKCA